MAKFVKMYLKRTVFKAGCFIDSFQLANKNVMPTNKITILLAKNMQMCYKRQVQRLIVILLYNYTYCH